MLLNPFNSLHCTQILMEEAVISCLFKNYRGHSIVVSLACLSTQTAFRTVCDPVHWWQLTEDGNVFWFSHTVPPENSWQDPWISSRHWHIVYRKNNFFSLSEPFQNSDGFNLFLAYYFWWQKEKHCKNQCNTLRMIFQQFIQQLHRHFLRSVLLYWMFDKCGNQSFVHAHGLSTGTDYRFLFIYLFLNHTALKYSSWWSLPTTTSVIYTLNEISVRIKK